MFCASIYCEGHRLAPYLDSDHGLTRAEGKGAHFFSV
jgi:hypothetical protein